MLIESRKLTIIESPYAGDIISNRKYLCRCILDSIQRGEAPFASHMMYPPVLDDDEPGQRLLGISCGFAWWEVAQLIAFYTDYGMSPGMTVAFERAKATGKFFVLRSIL